MSPLTDGYHPLPPGKLATLVTFLEMTEPPARPRRQAPPGYTLRPVERWDLAVYKALYTEIGWEWLWTSRLLIDEADLEKRLHAPGTRSFVPDLDGRAMGLLEMDVTDPDRPEIAFFGLVPDAIGAGVGGWLMDEAIAIAFAQPGVIRLWLHTCHFDSPQALPFYMVMGFTPFARAIEVFDDPRLLGKLAPGAGPHVPLIPNARLPHEI
ncbi:GNAT family N-acetyltransferase [Chthonobacter rhizosphaerae]|uniref:GNAT family N-acetyltransferase n=1 Tax=Chthonobacter rhizosphaerae TaxID=2735553 RepID=UPI0015EE7CA0|nr:GNAT family N-acetyltransferase [Chthonobacter rhizosphaerae]